MQTLKLAVLSLSLFALAGCGGVSTYPVTGTVTIDGNPMEGLLVSFSAVEGGAAAAGTTNADGVYRLTSTLGPGLPEGAYRVAVSEITVVDNATRGGSDESSSGSDNDAYARQALGGRNQYKRMEKKKKKSIPAKYNTKTTLQETVAAISSNDINFDLTTK